MAQTQITIRANDKTKKAFTGVNKSLRKVRSAINSTQLKIGLLAGAAGFGALIKSASVTADALAKQADKIGISTEALAGLQNAAELTGVSNELLNKALIKQQVAIADYSNGIGLAKREFEQLGFAQDELAKMSADEQFTAIAEALKGVSNSTDRVNIAYKIYGGRATDLLNTLDLGAEGLRKIREESELFGTSLSRVDAAKIEAANDAFTRIGQITKGFGMQLTAELAPIMEAITNKFVDHAKESGGMGEVATNAINNIIDAFGFLANAMRGIDIAWVGTQVLFSKGADFILDVLFRIAEGWRLISNLIPMVDIAPMTGFETLIKSVSNRTDELSVKLQTLAMTELPSSVFKKWSEEVQTEAQKVAEKIAAAKAAAGGSNGDDTDSIDAEKDNQRLAEKMARLELSLQTEKERLELAFEDKQFLIEEAFQNEMLSNQERVDKLFAIESSHQKNMAKLDAATAKSRTAVMNNMMSNLASLMNSKSRKMFEVGKIAAISETVINTHSAAMGAYKALSGIPIVGPALGVAAAAAAIAAGGMRINAIKSTTFGGGSAAGSGGNVPVVPGGAPVTGGLPELPAGSQEEENNSGTVNIFLNTSNFVDETALERIVEEKIVPLIRDGIDNRDVILISSGSRNAQELVPA